MNNHNDISGMKPQTAALESSVGYDDDELSHSPTAKMDFLRGQLAAQGVATEGMNWHLLMLEWKYDLSVLFGGLRHWMKALDTRFNSFRDGP